MTAPAALQRQLADEHTAKQRQYVLSNARARWSVVGIAVALLAGARVAGVIPISWSFIAGFGAAFAAANYGMRRLARDAGFRVWYAHLNVALGTALITAVAYAVGETGHLLYAAYLIAPLQAAYYLGREEAWQALVLNLAGFALLTALRQGGGGWNWTLYLEESLVLAFCCAALVPMLTKIVRRLRATREVLAQIERGDLTVALQDPESDELGYLSVSVNRTTEAIAATVRQVQRQAHDLAPMAQQLAASAQELQAAAQQISAAAQQLSSGTERQRQVIGQGREDSEEAARAGAQGLGFRVVADEVRKLSEQSTRSADEVRARVKLTQEEIGQVLEAMEQGRRTAEGVGTVSAAAREALEAIFADLHATVQFASAFAGETEGQARRIREVVRRMEQAAGIADSAAQGAEQTSAATAEQIASLDELTTTSQQLSAAATKLTETIQRLNVNGKA